MSTEKKVGNATILAPVWKGDVPANSRGRNAELFAELTKAVELAGEFNLVPVNFATAKEATSFVVNARRMFLCMQRGTVVYVGQKEVPEHE